MNPRNTEKALVQFIRQWLAHADPKHPLRGLTDEQIIAKLRRDWRTR